MVSAEGRMVKGGGCVGEILGRAPFPMFKKSSKFACMKHAS